MITSAVELFGRSPSPPRASREASSSLIIRCHGQSLLAALAGLAVGLPALRGGCWLAAASLPFHCSSSCAPGSTLHPIPSQSKSTGAA